MAKKSEAEGIKGGNEWDDSADHDNVTNIYVRGGLEGIQYVKFDYVKNGKPQTGSIRGLSGRGFTQPFVIDRKDEYLVSVEAYYDAASGVIQVLRFKTNKTTSEMMGYDNKGIKFSLESNGQKIIGFHGFAETNLNALGAYFTPLPPIKFPYHGGSGGQPWDDGPNYNGVRHVGFTLGKNEIREIRFDYDKGGLVERQAHGEDEGQQFEFPIDYPYEYITSVEGTCDIVSDATLNRVRSLTFTTSKNRTSPTFGNPGASKFVFESNGSAIIGFHGRAKGALDAIGAYFSPMLPSPTPPVEKLQAKGGDGGEPWDDGVFDNVRTIYIGQGENGVTAVKFVYDKDSRKFEGAIHGKNLLLDCGKFALNYPSEYIIAVEGCYNKIMGSENGVVTMLKFTTSYNRTSRPFGMESTSSFILGKEGYKIVGFHGKASDKLHQIGVYVVPITQ